MGMGIIENLPAIYDAAVDQYKWGEALDASAGSVDAAGAMILAVENSDDNPLQIGFFSHIWKDAPELIGEYNRDYAHLEQDAWESVASGPKHHFLNSSEFWADDPNILTRPDFLFLKKTASVGHRCAARLNDNNRWFEALTVHFPHTVTHIPETAIADLELIVPHIAKSMEMGRTFELLRNRYQAVLAALDYVDVGLCIALNDGSIVVHNKEAQRIFDLNDGLVLGKNRKLRLRHSETEDRMAQAVMAIGNTARGENTVIESIFSISRQSRAESFLVEVAPVRDVSAEIDSSLQGALVTIVDLDNTTPISIEHMAFAYGLSSAEKDVCRYAVDGWTNNDIADERGVSSETVKSQIGAVMQKTGTRNRAQLIRLAIKTSPPVRTGT